MMNFTIFYVQFPASSMGTANLTTAAVMKMLEPENNSLTECDECITVSLLKMLP
jgi:hypothetical protein